VTYLRGSIAPSAFHPSGWLRFPPEIRHEKTSPSHRSLEKRLSPSDILGGLMMPPALWGNIHFLFCFQLCGLCDLRVRFEKIKKTLKEPISCADVPYAMKRKMKIFDIQDIFRDDSNQIERTIERIKRSRILGQSGATQPQHSKSKNHATAAGL
jgi:hypothetical protein